MANDNIKTLYNALKDKYNLGSEADFRKSLTNEGNRRTLYNTIKDGYDLGTEQDFNKSLGYTTTTTPVQKTKVGAVAQEVVDEIDRQNNAPLSAGDKNRLSKIAGNIIDTSRASTQRARNIVSYNTKKKPINVPARVNLGENARVVKSGDKYITESGNVYDKRGAADLEQNQIDEYKERTLNPIETALRDAYAERDSIDQQMRERMKEIDDENKGVGGFLREFAEASRQPGMLNPLERYQTDEIYRQLESAARKNKATIQTLEDKRDNRMNDFWHSIATTAGNGYTFNDGLAEINDAIALMDARKYIDSINTKRQTGEPLTKEEAAAEAVLSSDIVNNEVQGKYAGDYGAWASAGQMVPTSVDFMKDFMLTPGAGGIAKGIERKVSGIGAKYLAKEIGGATAKEAAKTMARGLLKGTGILLGAHTAGAVISNTARINRTAGAMGANVAGRAAVDENGNIAIQDSMDMLDAFIDAERNQIRETGSEMFGVFIPGIGGIAKKGLEKIGLSKISNALTNIGNKQWYQQYDKLLTAGGYNGIPGEALEEYEGFAFDALTGNAEEAWNQLKDPRTHVDIWLGTAAMSALLGAVPVTLQGAHTARYYKYKHDTNKAERIASYRFADADKWSALRDRIDTTPNEQMADVVVDIMADNDLYPQQKTAALNYVRNLTKMRGFNIGQMANVNQQSADNEAANNSYSEGYNADDTQLSDIKNIYGLRKEQVANILGVDVELVDDTIGDPAVFVAELQQLNRNNEIIPILDYVNAKSRYDGMIQRVRDDLDNSIAESNEMIDSRVNRSNGLIQPATMKTQDKDGNSRQAYIINGSVEMLPDGSEVDYEKSSNSILIRYADTGELEMVSPTSIMSIGEPIDPEQERAEAEANITQSFAQPKADAIDGKVSFAPGDTYTLTDEKGQTAEAQVIANADGIVDNGDGTVNLTFDGGNTIKAVSKDDIQSMVDNTNRLRVAAQMESENQQQAQPETHQYNLNEELILQNPDGTQFTATVVDTDYNDGTILIEYDTPQGRRVMPYTKEQLDSMIVPENQTEEATIEQQIPDAETAQQDETQQPEHPEQPKVPIDENGNVIYEQLDPDTAWDTLVQEAGDEETARSIADSMVSDAESNLKKVSGKKLKAGTTAQEKLAEARQNKQAMDDATALLNHWKAIASTQKRRQQAIEDERKKESEEAARIKKEEEEKMRAQKEEEERIKREALKGVPDFVEDTPQDARARGYRRVNGEKIDRQEPITGSAGKEISIKFDDDNIPSGNVAIIDVDALQPSHINGQRNPLHFIDEAQPKERKDDASVMSARKIAENIRPEEITSSVTAYTGAPTINSRGEVIQGNNRSAALKELWTSYPEQAEKYKQYLIDHAEEFGLNPDDIAGMEHPVLVNLLDVSDADAIKLGQFIAQDTESGGIERMKPKNIVQKLGNDIRTFAGQLLKSADEEMTFAALVDKNGPAVLKWLQSKGYITPTQYKSAFNSKGTLTDEAKNDIKGIMFQSIFKDGNTALEEMFNALPAKAQKAILATAYRDYDSPNADRMNTELQNSIRAYYALSQVPEFANAKNYKEARAAVEDWKRQLAFDDVTGESYLPSERYTNFAILLATMYKGQTQTLIQNTFNNIYDLVQGKQETTLFDQPDNTPRTLTDAINEAINKLSDNLLINNFEYGQQRGNVLAGGSTAGQQRGQRGTGDAASGERAEITGGPSVSDRSIKGEGKQEEVKSDTGISQPARTMIESPEEANAARMEDISDRLSEIEYRLSEIQDEAGVLNEAERIALSEEKQRLEAEYNGLKKINEQSRAIQEAENQVNTEPTDAQKEAGNYRKGHVRIDGYDITIEQPKGSTRRGIDENGKKWEQTMNNTYGYIRGTEGVDGDHIDIFLSDNPTEGNVYVVDQVNPDGSFDEHKVMYGFNSADEARNAYLSNYEEGWQGLGTITEVSKDEFKKWVENSHRKTKPFAEYKSVNAIGAQNEESADKAMPIQGLQDYSRDEIKNIVKDYIEQKMSDYDIDAEIKGIEIHGSRNRGDARDDSDLDVVFEYEGDIREDDMFNTLNDDTDDEALHIEGIRVDINPIREQETGTLDRYMERSREYDEEKKAKEYLEDIKKKEDKAQSEGRTEYYIPVYDGWGGQRSGLFDKVWLLPEDVNKDGSDKSYRALDLWDKEDTYYTEEGFSGVRKFLYNKEELDKAYFGKENNKKVENKKSVEEKPTTEKKSEYGSQNKIVSKERYEELKKRMIKKLGQLNFGMDPELLEIGIEMTAYHLESGARKFADYARAMIKDIGDVIRPYLKSFYNAARDYPGVADAGITEGMSSSEEVSKFDVANFDKTSVDAMATAENVVKEQEIKKETDKIVKENEQTTANTEAIESKAKTIASNAEGRIEKATTEEEIDKAEKEVDKELQAVDNQLSQLNYVDNLHSGMRVILKDGRNVLLSIVMHKGEQISATQMSKPRVGRLYASYKGQLLDFGPDDVDVEATIQLNEPKEEQPVKEEKAQKEISYNGYKIGDKVIYTPFNRTGKPEEATIYDFEAYGDHKPVLDTGLAPVIYEVVEWNEIKHAKETTSKTEKSKKKIVSSQKIADLLGDVEQKQEDKQETDTEDNTGTATEQQKETYRQFSVTVKNDMLSALDSGEKPYRSILDLRKRASQIGMEIDNEGRTDILIQELVENGLVMAAREVIKKNGNNTRNSYDLICKLYDMQPTIAARSSNRIKMQQYSTPLPMSWIADRFAMTGKEHGNVLEPTAGNGMLVFAVPVSQVHANELDKTRLDNLREQGFAKVTEQDATEPFEGERKYDAIIANPPFGSREAVEYDGKMISGLDPQITLNALNSMKDNGRAAIIIGGNMEYAKNGAIKSMKPFFTYLYDHYNVKGVIDMDGKLYAKQGTTFPTRMILIDGRRSEEERAQTTVYPPVKSKAIRKADSFSDLYDIIDEVLNSKEKTNGTEILHSRERKPLSISDRPSGTTERERRSEQYRKNDTAGRGNKPEGSENKSKRVLSGEPGKTSGISETRNEVTGSEQGGSRRSDEPAVQRVGTERVPENRVGLKEETKKRSLTEEKLPYRPHNTAFSLNSVAPAAMVEAMDNVLSQIERENGNIDEFVRKELGYDTIEELHQALAAEQLDSVAMAIYQMKKGQALIIGDQTGVGKGRQMAALIRWAVNRGEKPIFITQKADLFSDIYRDLVDIGSGDLVPFIFNADGAMVDANGNVVHKPLSSTEMSKVFASGTLPDNYDFAVLTYSQVNTGDSISQKELEEAAKKRGTRTKKSKASKTGKPTPKATFLRSIAEDNYLFLDESHTAAGSSNTGAYLQSILRNAKAVTFASATFAKRPDTMPLYAIRTAMSKAKVEPDKMIGIIEKGGVTLQEIMSRELTNAGQMVRRERDMSDVKNDWKTIDDPETVKRARENYDSTIKAFNAIIKFQEDYVKPKIDDLDQGLAIVAQSAGVKKGTDKMGVENVPFASKTYNYTKQLMLALKVDAITDEVEKEIKAGRHPVIALESTMESTIKDYSAGEVIEEPTFSASLLKGLDSVMQYTVTDENGKESHASYKPSDLGKAGEEAYYELQKLIKESTSNIFISPLDAIIERLHEKGYKVGELTGRNLYVEKNDNGQVVVKRRTDKDKKKMQREFNNGTLDVLILNKSASTGISLHASEKFSDQRQRSMIIAQPLSDINDYMQMIGRIDRTGQVHRGYYINLGLPVPAENRFLMMLSTKLKSLNANTTTSQDSKSNEVEAPDLLNKYGSQVVVEYLRDNVEIYEKMGLPLKKQGAGGARVQSKELEEYKSQEDDARKITGYVALLNTKEQEEFYNDVVRRYNELIKYLNDTGSNDLKITVMPLRAKTLEKRISSEGIDPNGTNPFAKNAYVELVEMDVLRKPMKADEIKKAISQINKDNPEQHIKDVVNKIQEEKNAKIASEQQRYEKAKAKALEDINKQAEKINRQQKRTEEEKREAIRLYTEETNDKVEDKHNDNLSRLDNNYEQLIKRLSVFQAGKPYLVPDNLETLMFDFASPAIFCGYKAKESKITASTTFAVFATLDGRRRIEVKLSDTVALQSIYKMTNDNWDAAQATTLDNWDSQIPTETRKQGYIMTGNILQAIADTQDEHGSYTGQLISYTDMEGNIHDGILMPDKWNRSMLKTGGAPLISRIEQIKRYEPIISMDGKVSLVGSNWAKTYYLTVPKTKKDGAIYYENATLLKASNGGFYPYHGKLRADISENDIDAVVNELTKLGVKVKENNDIVTPNEEESNDLYREVDDDNLINELESQPKVKVYRAMQLQDGKLLPPMSGKVKTTVKDSKGNEKTKWEWREPTKLGVWEEAEERPDLANDDNTFTLNKGSNSIKAAYNPYIHTSRSPINDQFSSAWNRNELVTVEVEVPESELTSGYKADKAKDAVGEVEWKSGPIGRQLAKIGKPRLVILSRWDKPIRILPVDEVANEYAKILKGTNIEVPFNTVTPELRDALVRRGVKIGAPENNNAGRASINAYNEWISKQNYTREGNGPITDNELSIENDPVPKMLGKSTRTKAQQKKFAERERQRMEERVRELAEKLHLDNVDIITDASTLEGRRAKAKGFYSRKTGRITIVIPNHTSVFDAEQTLLHEAVAHYGLRKLFGTHFDTFLNNVFNNADEDVRARIVELAKKHNWDFATATEEYLASLAENTNFENINAGWWSKIKDLFIRMLHSIGFENFSGVTLSDNELRYILWRSYENLAEPGRYRSILGEAKDIAKQSELKVGNYAVNNASQNAADDLYRDGDPEVHERTFARRRYEERVNRGMYQTQEAIQDSMLGLKEAMQAILKGEGKKNVYIEDVPGFENAYLGENRLSSVNQAETNAFANILFKPLLKEVSSLAPNNKAREELTDYMMAKHGLERNRVMAERDAQAAYDTYIKKHPNSNKTLQDFIDKYREKDYAGLTALTATDNVSDAEFEAQQMVDSYESNNNTDELWKKTKAVSDAILSKLYDTGMISKDTYDNVRSMYDYYIPLRGFDEKTSEEAYAYLNSSNSAFNAPIKTARGRKSKADDPFAYLQSMAESAIMQGNRNKLVKQRFLNFALNHPSDLVSISDIWLKYNHIIDEWEPVFPDNIKSTDTAEEVESKMKDFEEKMSLLAEQDPDMYKHGKDAINIPYRVVNNRELHQHQVIARRNGRDYVITINGNPRAAQALNGQTNPDNDMSGAIGAILKTGEWLNRELSALYTTRNPDFVVSNFIRDMLYANSMVWVKETPNYALRFHHNYMNVNPAKMKMLFAKHRKNALNMNDKTERMFYQFIMNGGETGYVNMRDIEKRKNDIRREIQKSNGKLPVSKAWDLLSERFDEVNRAVENCARFAAFMTSVEMGRSIDRAIYDAKEISVNFNKKGSGAKFMSKTGQTKLGNAAAFISGLGKIGFVFWNAAIQGSTNFGRQAKRHPVKTITSLATMFILGAVIASLGYDDDDDDNKNSYWNLPEYVRRSNILFRAGDQWISIPLPVEYRSVYGLGELMISTMSGKEHLTSTEFANQIASQISQVMPLDFLEGDGGLKTFIPSAIKPVAEAYGYNKSWTGLPIYKDTPYNKNNPEWTKAYKNANKYLVALSETLNEASGGDNYKKGYIDINPAKIEHVLTGYFGGVANTIDRMTKMGETILGQREYDPNNFLVLNRIIKNGDERTEAKAINKEYFRLKDEYEETQRLLRSYENESDNGILEYAEKLNFLYNSPEYRRYEIFDEYRPYIEELNDMLKETNDKDEIKDMENELIEIKKMMISDIDATRNMRK